MSDIEELYKSLLGEEDTKDQKRMSMEEILSIAKLYWQYIWKKKWIVIAIGILGGLLGLGYAFVRKINYTASYSFTVAGSSSSSFSLGGLSSLLGGVGGGSMDAFSGDNIIELLKSKTMVENTLLSPVEYNGDTITFMEYSLICDSVRAKCESGEVEEPENDKVSICDIQYPVELPRAEFSRVQDSILMQKSAQLIKNCISVSRRDKKLAFMDYSFTYPDEMFAMKFALSHLTKVTEFYSMTKTSLSRKNVSSFEHKADSVYKDLCSAISRRAAFMDGNRNASGMYVSSQLQKIEIDIQVLATTYQEMQKNIQMLKLDLARETPLIQMIDTPTYPLKNDKMRKLKGLVVGGFLGGFLSVLGLVLTFYFLSLKNKSTAVVEQSTKND